MRFQNIKLFETVNKGYIVHAARARSIITGIIFALFMAKSGGTGDNAKKYIEVGDVTGYISFRAFNCGFLLLTES